MCEGVGLIGLLGAAKRLMLSSAMRPPWAEPLAPFMGVVVPLGTAAGAIVVAQIPGFSGCSGVGGEGEESV